MGAVLSQPAKLSAAYTDVRRSGRRVAGAGHCVRGIRHVEVSDLGMSNSISFRNANDSQLSLHCFAKGFCFFAGVAQ
jgi:hypothetical protein